MFNVQCIVLTFDFVSAETALHVAVKNRHVTIVSALLSAGANPNLRMYLPPDHQLNNDDNFVFTGSSFLVLRMLFSFY